jgi:hypothetical protein
MQYEVHKKPVVKDGAITIQLHDSILQSIAAGKAIDIRIRPVQNLVEAEHRGYYYGVMIPTIIAQYKHLNGVRLTDGEVDLINKRDAASGTFTLREVDDEVYIRFKELSLSKMNVQEFASFIDKCQLYWSEKGIQFT